MVYEIVDGIFQVNLHAVYQWASSRASTQQSTEVTQTFPIVQIQTQWQWYNLEI